MQESGITSEYIRLYYVLSMWIVEQSAIVHKPNASQNATEIQIRPHQL